MGKNYKETFNEQLQNPEFKAEWKALEPRILELFIESLFIVLSHRLSLLLVYDSCHTRYECLFLETQFPEERCRLGTLYRR